MVAELDQQENRFSTVLRIYTSIKHERDAEPGAYPSNGPKRVTCNQHSRTVVLLRRTYERTYGLVRVQSPKLSLPRILLAISSQRVNIWYHIDPHDQRRRVRGWHGQFFFNGVGPYLGAKLVSTNDSPSMFQQSVGAFSKRGRITVAPHLARSGRT